MHTEDTKFIDRRKKEKRLYQSPPPTTVVAAVTAVASQNFGSLPLTDWDYWCYEDWEEKYHLMT